MCPQGPALPLQSAAKRVWEGNNVVRSSTPLSLKANCDSVYHVLLGIGAIVGCKHHVMRCLDNGISLGVEVDDAVFTV